MSGLIVRITIDSLASLDALTLIAKGDEQFRLKSNDSARRWQFAVDDAIDAVVDVDDAIDADTVVVIEDINSSDNGGCDDDGVVAFSFAVSSILFSPNFWQFRSTAATPFTLGK